MIGTASDRFTIKVPADELAWVATRLRAELIKRELATAAELAIDEAGEAAMAAKAAAKEQKAAQMAAAKKVQACSAAKKQAAAAVEAAKYDESKARLKRMQAENTLLEAKMAKKISKVEQLAATPGPVQPLLKDFLSRHARAE